MKRVGLVGLSAAAAAMIMAGCGGGGGGSSSGLSAPTELTTPTEVNLSQARKVMGILGEGIITEAAAPKIAATLQKIETNAEKAFSTKSAGSGSETFDCEKGSYTISLTDHSITCEMKNCVSHEPYIDDYAYMCDVPYAAAEFFLDSDGVPIYTFNGKVTGTETYVYDDAKDVTSANITIEVSNYKRVNEDNVTGAGDVTTANFTHVFKTSNDGDYIYFGPYSAEEPAYNLTTDFTGSLKWVAINESGSVDYGYMVEGDVSLVQDGRQDVDVWGITANGFISYYDIMGTENNATFDQGIYAEDFSVSYNGSAAPEQNLTVNGVIGSACLGGSVTVATEAVMQTNINDYDNNESDGTLPYAGKITIKGTTDANVTFDNNTTHSFATISTTEGNTTYGAWSTLAEGCYVPLPPEFPYYYYEF